MTNKVCVRFAPSPTGYLHVGGARTAIFNWLFARKNNGKFLLRIEDTDAERSSEDLIQGILDGLEWLGIDFDEGPYFQSHFMDEHRKAAQTLLENGHAYRCFCEKEELDRKREEARKNKAPLMYDGTCRDLTEEEASEKEAGGLPYTIRMKVPRDNGSVLFTDIVYGEIEKKHEDIEDFVILRSNGQPLYILSNTIDDIRDHITHVIRGQDGLANTPKQILIYRALGAPIPEFAHMSFALDPKKAKISKRKHGEKVAVHFYKESGFLPWAMVNFLSLLGWSTPDSQQIFSKEELIDIFSLKGINKSNCIFDVRANDPKFFTDPKAFSINAHYLRNLPVAEIVPYVKQNLKKNGLWKPEYDGEKQQWFFDTLELLRERFHLITDFSDLGRAFLSDNFERDPKAVEKNILKYNGLKDWLPELADRLQNMDGFFSEQIEQVIRKTAEDLDVKIGILINGIRTVITGQSVGPGFIEMLLAIGKNRVIERLRQTPDLF